MGLDQWAIRVKRENIVSDLEFKKGEYLSETNNDTLGNDLNFYYWRSFSSLDLWFEGLYRKKGGKGDFNCMCVRLDADDLDALYIDAQEDTFYELRYDEAGERRKMGYEHLMEFIQKAKKAIQEGNAIYYTSWW